MAESTRRRAASQVARDYWAELAEPVPPEERKLLPAATRGEGDATEAVFVPYIDARFVMRRLDEVIGPGNWRDEYRELLADKGYAFMCTLSVRLPGDDEWVSKQDVGTSEPDDQEPVKAAVSDSLKRAAVKFGIARELADAPKRWEPAERRGRAVIPRRRPAQQPPQQREQARPAQTRTSSVEGTEWMTALRQSVQEHGWPVAVIRDALGISELTVDALEGWLNAQPEQVKRGNPALVAFRLVEAKVQQQAGGDA